MLDVAQTYADIIAYIGFSGALLGWLYQWNKSREARKQEIRLHWDSITTIKAIMEEIESAGLRSSTPLSNEVYQAHAQLAVLYRATLARAISQEGNVTLKTIMKWRKIGKLGSDWQQKCAMSVLLTEEITESELDNIDEKFSTWEAVDNTTTFGSGNPTDDPARRY